MSLSATDENELLTVLHSAVFQEEQPWRLFVSRLRARTRADLCRLSLRSAGETEWVLLGVASTPVADASIKPSSRRDLADLRIGRVYLESDLPSVDGLSERHLRIAVANGNDVALSLVKRGGDLGASVSSLLTSLSPHVAIAVGGHLELRRERMARRAAEQVFERYSTSWFLVDARGRIVDSGRGASALLADGRAMHRAADGRLRFSSTDAEDLLETVLSEHPLAGEARAAWVSFDPPIQIVAMRPPEQYGALRGPHCLLVLREVEGGDLGGGRHLRRLFRLTRAEAALAAEIAKGTRIAQAGEILGLTTETARDYSKKVYIKMRAKGQSDVARLVLNGVSLLG